jgi:hypothetical protein
MVSNHLLSSVIDRVELAPPPSFTCEAYCSVDCVFTIVICHLTCMCIEYRVVMGSRSLPELYTPLYIYIYFHKSLIVVLFVSPRKPLRFCTGRHTDLLIGSW